MGNVLPENLLWVVPNEAWITAREKIGNCIDLLYTSAKLHDDATGNDSSEHIDEKKETETSTDAGIGTDFFQRGFIEWENKATFTDWIRRTFLQSSKMLLYHSKS